MRKVLIIGGNGSGKTTMARQLAEITGLPLCHLDTLYWTDDWQPRERSDFITLLQAELEKEEWILDGNMRRTLPQRLPYCDTVIYLDFSGIRCFFGTLKRLLQNHGQSRPDMGGIALRGSISALGLLSRALYHSTKNTAPIFITRLRRIPMWSLLC